jgi:hypothetical protein
MEPHRVPGLTGRQIKRIMRQNRVTIRELARRMDATMKSIRKGREVGSAFPGCLDYWQAATGSPELSPRLRAQLRQYLRMKHDLVDLA